MLSTVPSLLGVLAEVPCPFDHAACRLPRRRPVLGPRGLAFRAIQDSGRVAANAPRRTKPGQVHHGVSLPDPTGSRSVTTGLRSIHSAAFAWWLSGEGFVVRAS
jgi:hypothetical protein